MVCNRTVQDICNNSENTDSDTEILSNVGFKSWANGYKPGFGPIYAVQGSNKRTLLVMEYTVTIFLDKESNKQQQIRARIQDTEYEI